MTAQWTKTIRHDALRTKGRVVLRRGGKQIVMFQTPEGVFACNNRCPHEGYPLSQGNLDGGCTLTCNWHNWKFDLRNGANHYGGDRLRLAGGGATDAVIAAIFDMLPATASGHPGNFG